MNEKQIDNIIRAAGFQPGLVYPGSVTVVTEPPRAVISFTTIGDELQPIRHSITILNGIDDTPTERTNPAPQTEMG